MRYNNGRTLLPQCAVFLALTASNLGFAAEIDHREFEATLHVPYKADSMVAAAKSEARTFTLEFDYPYVANAQNVSWRLELVGPGGQVVQHWTGVQRLYKKPVTVKVRWAGRSDSISMPDGQYQVRMRAVAHDAAQGAADNSEAAVDQALAAGGDEIVEQAWELAIGKTAAPAMPFFQPLQTTQPAPQMASQAAPGFTVQSAAPAPASLPYTVYQANLHSQTNHSDGGSAVTSCTGAAEPLKAPFGPADAFAYAKNRGLDILMASEHNHMFDGSSGHQCRRQSHHGQGAVSVRPDHGGRLQCRQSRLPGRVRHGMGRHQQWRPHEHLQLGRVAWMGIQQRRPIAGRHLH